VGLSGAELGLPNELISLGRYNYARAESPLSPHDHGDAVEFAYLVKGRQVYHIDARDVILGAGDVFVSLPHQTHSTANWPEEKGILYWLVVRIPRGRRRWLGLSSAESAVLRDRLLNLPGPVFAVPQSVNLMAAIDAVFLTHFGRDDPLKPIAMKARCLEMVLRFLTAAESGNARATRGEMNELLAYIESRLHRTLSVTTLAERMGLSESWFKAKFLKHVGMSPAQYILTRKIDRARTLLADPRRSVTAIAMDLGFSSSGYFATAFKRLTGQSPIAFAKSAAARHNSNDR
jgi:AraC-like DNA-binding protein